MRSGPRFGRIYYGELTAKGRQPDADEEHAVAAGPGAQDGRSESDSSVNGRRSQVDRLNPGRSMNLLLNAPEGEVRERTDGLHHGQSPPQRL